MYNLAMMFKHNKPSRYGLGALGYKPMDFRGMIGGSGFRMRGGIGGESKKKEGNPKQSTDDVLDDEGVKTEVNEDDNEDDKSKYIKPDDLTPAQSKLFDGFVKSNLSEEEFLNTIKHQQRPAFEKSMEKSRLRAEEERNRLDEVEKQQQLKNKKISDETKKKIDEMIKPISQNISAVSAPPEPKGYKPSSVLATPSKVEPKAPPKVLTDEQIQAQKDQAELDAFLEKSNDEVKRDKAIREIRMSKKINPKSILENPSTYHISGIDSNKGYELETVKNADKLVFDDGTPLFDEPLINQELNPLYYKNGNPITTMFKDKYTGEYNPKPIAELTPYDLSLAPSNNKLGLLIDNKNKHNESIDDKGGVEIQIGKFTGDDSPNDPQWININQFNGKPEQMVIYNISTNSAQLKADKLYQGDGYTPALLVRLVEGDFYADLNDFVKEAFIPTAKNYQGGKPITAKFRGREYQTYSMKYNPASGFNETVEEFAPTLKENPTRADRIKYKEEMIEYKNKPSVKKKNPTSVYVPKKYLQAVIKK